ncbi:MAG: leucine-rich repeat domain-containing protein [Prevotella sp.]
MKKKFYSLAMCSLMLIGLGVMADGNNPKKWVVPVKSLSAAVDSSYVSSGDTTMVEETDTSVVVPSAPAKIWDFKLSENTISMIQKDCSEVGFWIDYGNYFVVNNYWLEGNNPFAYYCYNEEGYIEGAVIPELEGLVFGAISGYEGNSPNIYLYHDGTDRIRLNRTYITLGIEDVYAGQTITIRYKSANTSSMRGLTCYSGNAEITGGAATTDGTEADVTFTVTSSGTVQLVPSGGLYISSIQVGNVADAYANALNATKELLDSVQGYAAIYAELQASIDSASVGDNATDEEYAAAITVLNETASEIQKVISCISSFDARKAEADSLLAVTPSEDLSAALQAANQIANNTVTSSELLEVNQTLSVELAIYKSTQIDRDSWAFNTSVYVTVDGLRYYLDETNHLAEFVGLPSYNVAMDELAIPSVIRNNGVDYAVVAIINNYRYEQNTISKVSLPKTLQYIGSYAFYSYHSLTEIDIPALVSYIGDNAFYYNTSMKEIYLHGSTPFVCGSNVFYGCSSSMIVHVPDGSFHDYRISSSWGSYVIVPETPVEIALEVVDAGELGRLALDKAGYLQEINKLIVSGTLNNDDWKNLQTMSNLIEVDMSGLINTSIPSSLLYGRGAIRSVVLPSNVETIGSYAFCETGITTIDFPQSLKTIDSRAFYGTDITTIAFPQSLETIGSEAFHGTDITTIDFPQSLKTIDYRAFYSCTKLQSVVLPASLTSLGSDAFRNCSSLQSVKLNEGLTFVSQYCFSGCDIRELVLPSTLQTIGSSAFYANVNLQVLNCPESLVEIGSSAFKGCGLKEVNLNEGLQTIQAIAFENVDSLTTVTLPSSLRNCTGYPFYGCDNLKTIISNAVVPPLTNGYCPIYNVDMASVKLLVPSWSLAEYQLAEGWNQFYTVEVTDYMPQNVVINKDFVFALRDTLAADYRPNIDLLWTDRSYTDGYGYSNYECGNLTINSRSKLPVNNFSMYMSPYAKYSLDYSQYYRIVNGSNSYSYTQYNPTCLMVNGEMRAENVTIHLMNRNSCWQFVSFPFDVRMSDIVPEDSLTQWVVREYSGENRAGGLLDSTWVNLTADDVLQAGKGYIMHCYSSASSPVKFKVTPLKESVNRQALFISEDRTVALEEHLSEFDHNRSWNLVGNPYPTFYDSRFLNFTAPLTIWNSRYNSYMAVSPVDDDFILSPGEAFFVQRPVDQESITFAKEGRQIHNHVRLLQDEEAQQMPRLNAPALSERQVINLILSDGEHSDRTRVVINENATAGYDLQMDASKFDAVDVTVPQLFTVAGTVRYAINERPLGDAVVELGVHVGAEGMFTLTLKNDVAGSIVIEDRLTGLMTEITAEKGYTFSADKAGDIMGRFFLHLNMQQGGATGIKSIESPEAGDDAPAYNLNGQRIDANTYKGVVVRKGLKRVK